MTIRYKNTIQDVKIALEKNNWILLSRAYSICMTYYGLHYYSNDRLLAFKYKRLADIIIQRIIKNHEELENGIKL